MAKPFIYLACGSAAMSAMLCKSRLEDALRQRGIKDYDLRICRVAELYENVRRLKPDVAIVTAGSFAEKDIECPVFSGVPLMMGVGVDALMDKIVVALKEKGKVP